MTKQEADKLISFYAKSVGGEVSGLNDKGFGGIESDEGILYFELADSKLICRALIYRFRENPKQGIVDGFMAEEKAGVDTGGGVVEYLADNRSLLLSRAYPIAVTEQAFASDMRSLLAASEVWGDEVLERVSAKVFNRASKP